MLRSVLYLFGLAHLAGAADLPDNVELRMPQSEVIASLMAMQPVQETTATPTPPPVAAPAKDKTSYDPTSINLGLGAIMPKGIQFQPLSKRERFRLWKRSMFLNPQTYVRTSIWALSDLGIENSPYATGPLGVAQRFGSRYARSAIATSTYHGLAAAAGYDLRYVRSSSTNVGKRILHAMFWDYQALNREGKRVFNWPRLVAIYSSEMLSAAWTPQQKWSAYGVQSANQQLLFGWGPDIFKEFLPEAKRLWRKLKH